VQAQDVPLNEPDHEYGSNTGQFKADDVRDALEDILHDLMIWVATRTASVMALRMQVKAIFIRHSISR
jgi:hypothetical protein